MKTFLIGVVTQLLAFGAIAQAPTTTPIRIIVPYAPGGPIDAIPRLLQPVMSRALGQVVLVENKSGAAGAIGTREVARAASDGLTLLMANNGPHSIVPVMNENAGYDGVADFTPIALVTTTPMLLVVNPNQRVQSLKAFLDLARSSKAGLTYSSTGIGSFSHLATEKLLREAGVKAVHVPYRGQALAVNAVVNDEVQFALTTPSAMLRSFIDAGRLRLVGVSSLEPSKLAPGTATISSEVAGFSASLWYGLLAPKGVPQDVQLRLHNATMQAIQDPKVAEALQGMGGEVREGPPDLLGAMMRQEQPVWASLVNALGLRQ